MSNLSSEGSQGSRAESARGEGDRSAPLILCIDSATDQSCVAVARGARVVAKSGGGGERGQSLALLSEIDAALRGAGVSLGEIDLFAVAVGPGSFTGLRAALATVKAFVSVEPRPVAAIQTLRAVAASAGTSAQTFAAIQAGRGEVFAQTLSVGEDGRVEELTAPRHVSPSDMFAQALATGGPVKWAGGAVRAHAALMREVAAGAGVTIVERGSHVPSHAGGRGRVWELATGAGDYSAALAAQGLINYQDGRTVGAADLRALYVRPSDAELKERCPG
ncbi:MAG: tRNA (adenosine(37)-N6)-threonylcarbamoyltransferase complex dimerization subunit type 1 TsaB [Acidobacteria bacterium]|nr:tRNA (adenosine(37)-N6)-threonylcarbamoyltransferase complex dimerization subunit type 1 TsaB [Acidobacteriota bacterium]